MKFGYAQLFRPAAKFPPNLQFRFPILFKEKSVRIMIYVLYWASNARKHEKEEQIPIPTFWQIESSLEGGAAECNVQICEFSSEFTSQVLLFQGMSAAESCILKF